MTKNQEYTAAVARGEFPTDCFVPLDDQWEDSRGVINNLLLEGCQSVAAIVSKRGSVRANHLHATDWHYAFVAAGSVLYFEREPSSTEIPTPRLFQRGQMFFTRPGVEHAMLFAEDSLILTFAKNRRDHEGHEADLQRVEFVTPEIAARWVA